MTRFLIMVVILFTAYIPKTLIALDAPSQPTPQRIEDYIRTYASLFHTDADTLYSVMLCESQGKWIEGDYKNGKYHAFGHFQYWTDTWNGYAQLFRDTYGVQDQFDIHSIHDEAKLTAFVFSLGEDDRNQWTTFTALKNGGTYRFYSKVLGRWYTVNCFIRHMTA